MLHCTVIHCLLSNLSQLLVILTFSAVTTDYLLSNIIQYKNFFKYVLLLPDSYYAISHRFRIAYLF